MAADWSTAHRRRLREIWRSAGWPCQDMLEVELLAAGLLQRLRDAAYLGLSGECWYVIREGIARVDEIPPQCGLMIAGEGGLEVARPAPKRPMRMNFGLWMALARAAPIDGGADEDAQGRLGASLHFGAGEASVGG